MKTPTRTWIATTALALLATGAMAAEAGSLAEAQRPLSRAEVQADLLRAHSDGSLLLMGIDDPYAPRPVLLHRKLRTPAAATADGDAAGRTDTGARPAVLARTDETRR